MITQKIGPDFQEWDALHGLILDAFAYMDNRIDPPSSAKLLTADMLKEKARSEIGYIVRMNGKIVGCVFCKPEPDCLYIGKLAVSTAVRKSGIGRMLLQAAIAKATALGLSALRLQTRVELTENHARFAKWGFTETARSAHPGYDTMTSIEMRLPI